MPRSPKGDSIARIKLRVPAELVDPLYQDLQMVWEDRGESTMESETGLLAPDGDSGAGLRRANAQRHAASQLLDQVDWDSRREDEPVDLVGDHAFLASSCGRCCACSANGSTRRARPWSTVARASSLWRACESSST